MVNKTPCLTLVLFLLQLFNIKCSQLWDDQDIIEDSQRTADVLDDIKSQGYLSGNHAISRNLGNAFETFDRYQRGNGNMGFSHMRGKRNFDDAPLNKGTNYDEGIVGQRIKKLETADFRTDQQEGLSAEDDGNMNSIPARERRYSSRYNPGRFIASRGKRFMPMDANYRQILGKLLRAASQLDSLRTKSTLPQKRRGFSALRG